MEVTQRRNGHSRRTTKPGELEANFARFLADGDREGLTRSVELASPELLRIALYHVPHRPEAEDLVQATVLTAIERAETFQRGRRVMPWLVGILLNKIASARRDTRRREGRELEPPWRPEPSPLSVAEANEVERLVTDALEQLPPRYREVLSLYLHHGKGGHEIATELRRPQGTIRAQIHRGLRQLRALLPPSLALGALLTWVRGGAPGRSGTPSGTRGSGSSGAMSAGALRLARVGALTAAPLAVVGAIAVGAALLSEGGPVRDGAGKGVLAAPATAAGRAPSSLARESERVSADGRAATAAAPEAGPAVGAPGLVFHAVDRTTQRGIPGVLVRLAAKTRAGEEVTLEARTGEDGRAAFDLDPRALTSLTAEPEQAGYEVLRASWNTARKPLARGYALPLPLVPTRPIGGTVVDPEGRPVAGAHVYLVTWEVRDEGVWVLADRELDSETDAAGRWRHEAPVHHGKIRLRVVHPDYVSDLGHGSRVTPPAADLESFASRMVLERTTATELVVRDASGAPVVGARVQVFERRDPPRHGLQLATDAGGVARFALDAAETFILIVSAPDLARRLRTIGPPHPTHLELVLRPAETVRFFLREEGLGEPVPDALVRRFGEPRESAQRTDAEGAFAIPLFAGSGTWVEIRRPDVLGGVKRDVSAEAPDGLVFMPAPARLEGRVNDAATGAPLSDFQVRLLHADGVRFDALAFEGAAGEYALRFHPPGDELLVEITRAGYAPVRSDLLAAVGGAVVFDAALRPVPRFELTVVDAEGRPVDFAEAIVCQPGRGARLVGGELRTRDAVEVFTRGDGGLSFNRPASPFALAVVGGGGFAFLLEQELGAHSVVHTKPWGRVEGRAAPDRAGETVSLRLDALPDGAQGLAFTAEYRTRVEADGGFRFDSVPAGPVTVLGGRTPVSVDVVSGGTTTVVLP